MKKVCKPLSMTRDVKSGMQIFREVELRGVCGSRQPKWPAVLFGGPYRERK